MQPLTGRKLLLATVTFLMLAGIFIPASALVEAGTSTQAQSQLTALVAAAQTSKEYAYSTVDLAVSHGLEVSAAQAQLSQGDTLLSSAQADAQSGTNTASGIQSAQEAMSVYTSAATSAGVALTNAGLTAYVDYSEAVGAVDEVNATASLVASAAARACDNVGTGAFVQACAQVSAQIGAARLHLEQAAALLVQSNGQAGTSVSLSQAASLTTEARTEVSVAESDLASVASYTYSQRGAAYVSAVLLPLSASANATIAAEGYFQTALLGFQTTYDEYARSQVPAAEAVASSASALAAAISSVNTGGVGANITAAQAVAASVSSDMSALLQIPGITVLPTVVTDINSCSAATAAYNSSLVAAGASSGAFAQTSLPSFSSYLSAMNSTAAAVSSSGTAYVTACQKVMVDLSGLLAIQGVLAIYNNLTSLNFSAGSSSVNASLNQETAAMATVQSDFSSATSVLLSSGSKITGESLVSPIESISSQGVQFLNVTASSALSNAVSSVKATIQSADSFVFSANSSLEGTVGAFPAGASALGSAGVALSSQTTGSTASVTSAAAYVNSDFEARASDAAAGRAEITNALQLFSNQDIAAGAAALAEASLELQAASATYA